jgi:hypothetical protein
MRFDGRYSSTRSTMIRTSTFHAHAIYVDGILIPATNLVNGVTIVADARPEALSLTYFHIELERTKPSWRKV